VLIDPPFEERDELERLATGLEQGLQRFATGVYIAWYPIKDPKPVARFHAALAALAIPRSLRVELMLERPVDPDRLNGCGLVVVNPPYTLEGDLAVLLPVLSRRLASARGGAGYRLDWIDPAHTGGRGTPPGPKRRMRTRP
jgi:23S rRNA (adenine2030-N6)-methyltransferase